MAKLDGDPSYYATASAENAAVFDVAADPVATGQFTATWYDQFPGGCVTSRLHVTTVASGEFAGQAPQVLGFTTRAALQEALSQRSDGRLQLDPGDTR